jgi:general secretion pathway protein E
VRRLCSKCRKPVMADASVSGLLALEDGAVIYEAAGCDACGNSGYKGRIGVFEAIRIDDTIRRLINEGGDEVDIAAHAYANAQNLTAAAHTLVREGLTTPEEAIRISRRDSTDD